MSKQPVPSSRPVRTNTPARTAAASSRSQSARTTARKAAPAVIRPFEMPFEGKNIMMILVGLGVIVLGYLIMWMSPTMSAMAITISPIVLLIGYCIVIPAGILAGTKTFKKTTVVGAEQATNAMAS